MDVYLVGGAVRDRLLGLQPKERDWVVVGANEQQMRALGYRRVGRDFPVFLHPDTNEQYALARTERKSGHGYTGFVCDASAEVTLEDDLRRRDLTINAIAQDAQGGLTDPFGGQRDLELRVLRHVSEAFVEDPLRVLRVARFAARLAPLGFTVAPETMALMRALSASGELDYLVAERVWVETQNALGEPAPQEFVRVLRDCGALAVVFPEIDRLFGVPQPARHHPEVDTGAHLLLALQMAARLELSGAARFAVLTHDLGKALTPPEQWPAHIGHEKLGAEAVKQLCDRLGVPAKWRSVALKTCLHHTRCHRALELRASTIVDLLGDLDAFRQPEQFEECLRACEADARGRAGLQERAYVQADHLRGAFAAASAVGTADILERGISGPRVGEELRRLRIAAVRSLAGPKDDVLT